MSKSKRILFQLTGSIACFKACELVSMLVKAGYDVQIVATPAALRFVGEATLEGLTGKAVFTDIFSGGQAMEHIYAARDAELHLICPTTANTINKLAHGIADSVIGNLFLANNFKKPCWIVPAMNSEMYAHPVTQQSLKKLQSFGVRVFPTENGVLACGEVGEGRMVSPTFLFQEIENFFKPENMVRRKKVLITAGGTFEPIDTVRGISNRSSGRTGAVIADCFYETGWDVTFVHSVSSVRPTNVPQQDISFLTANELQTAMRELLKETSFDACIHLAAVSDFSVDYVTDANASVLTTTEKLHAQDVLNVHLKKRSKILDTIKQYALNPDHLKLVAFKLTHSYDSVQRKKQVEESLENKFVDAVVHNDMADIDHEKQLYRACLYKKNGVSQEVDSLRDLGYALEQYLREVT